MLDHIHLLVIDTPLKQNLDAIVTPLTLFVWNGVLAWCLALFSPVLAKSNLSGHFCAWLCISGNLRLAHAALPNPNFIFIFITVHHSTDSCFYNIDLHNEELHVDISHNLWTHLRSKNSFENSASFHSASNILLEKCNKCHLMLDLEMGVEILKIPQKCFLVHPLSVSFRKYTVRKCLHCFLTCYFLKFVLIAHSNYFLHSTTPSWSRWLPEESLGVWQILTHFLPWSG